MMVTLSATSRNGHPLQILHEDKGDILPEIDADGNRFECFTDYWEIHNAECLGAFVPRRPSDSSMLCEYVQCRKRFPAPTISFIIDERLLSMAYSLHEAGVDVATIRDPDGLNPFESVLDFIRKAK